jgi:molybdenum cofactor cytidylyltransferase
MAVDPNRIACIVLAAGRSERYGKADKLAAPLHGMPLVHHVLTMLNGFDFAQKIVVCQPTTLDVAGFDFERVDVEMADGLQSDSLRAGIRALRTDGLAGILIALGDMPAVSRHQIARLLARFRADETQGVVASGVGDVGVPPALFSIGLIQQLQGMTGDRGARVLLRDAEMVPTEPAELADVDTVDDLERVSNILT